jgi:hypothetical protein
MPRYFFHLRGDNLLVEDLEGMDLPNLHAALQEVERANREITSDGTSVGGLAFEVATREGRTLLRVPVVEVQGADLTLMH